MMITCPECSLDFFSLVGFTWDLSNQTTLLIRGQSPNRKPNSLAKNYLTPLPGKYDVIVSKFTNQDTIY